jgi:hypothetical protein
MLGLAAGVLAAGPNFYEWPVFASLATIVGGAIVGALLGYVAIALAYGSMASGPIGIVDETSGHDDGGGGGEGGSGNA